MVGTPEVTVVDSSLHEEEGIHDDGKLEAREEGEDQDGLSATPSFTNLFGSGRLCLSGLYVMMCVCVRVCMCACVRACMRVCVNVCVGFSAALHFECVHGNVHIHMPFFRRYKHFHSFRGEHICVINPHIWSVYVSSSSNIHCTRKYSTQCVCISDC